MKESLKPPYIEKITERGDIAVFFVDGAYIRSRIDEEFTNYGQHYRFPFIPQNEVWIDRIPEDADQKEVGFFIDHLLVEQRLMAGGMPYDRAIEKADLAERSERRKSGDVSRVITTDDLPDPTQLHVRLWKRLENGVSVWIVNGRLVRSVFDIDYTEGGHDHVYEFVPTGEVWIDNDLVEEERPFVLLHELHERNLMAKGFPYSKAHGLSSTLEYRCRHHPDELHDALAAEGWA
jgi:hypothetical protein